MCVIAGTPLLLNFTVLVSGGGTSVIGSSTYHSSIRINKVHEDRWVEESRREGTVPVRVSNVDWLGDCVCYCLMHC